MFLKQYNYKPKGNDVAVDTSADASADAKPATTGRRRSSATEKFAGLTAHKRNSQDAVASERRSSLAEQKPGTGILGGMWQGFTKGT